MISSLRHPSRRLGRLLPNVITLLSLCLGLTALRLAISQEWIKGLTLLCLAGICDGMDGRLARYLKSSTDFGAELDSLADFVNFGVTPAFMVYFHTLHQAASWGWMACVVFVACSALRLARFNVGRYVPHKFLGFSVGLPAPAGAFFAVLPLIISVGWQWVLPPAVFFFMQFLSAALMVSQCPILVLKNRRIPSQYLRWVLMGSIIVIGSLIADPWTTVIFLGVTYGLTIPWTLAKYYKKPLIPEKLSFIHRRKGPKA